MYGYLVDILNTTYTACQHTHTHTSTHTHTNTHTRIYECMHACAHTHKCTRASTHTCTYTRTCAHKCTCAHTPTHTHTHIHEADIPPNILYTFVSPEAQISGVAQRHKSQGHVSIIYKNQKKTIFNLSQYSIPIRVVRNPSNVYQYRSFATMVTVVKII